jgi:hypothetical protein
LESNDSQAGPRNVPVSKIVIEEKQQLSEENNQEFDSPVHVQAPLNNKTPNEPFQPDQHHSVPPNSGLEGSNSSYTYHHISRNSNSKPDFERIMKPALNLPLSSNKKAWKELNTILADVLPRIFSQDSINALSTTKLSNKFDTFLYGFLKEHCGVVAASEPIINKHKGPRPHRGLERLRQRKNQASKAWKLLKRNGFEEDSPEARLLHRNWTHLLRAHNRLRNAVAGRHRQWRKVEACRQFKKQPYTFAKKLFQGSRMNGSPSFSKDTAEQYFGKTYRDANRDHVYTPLEGMSRPDVPRFPFLNKPPSYGEVCRSVRPKRNKAAPGMNALSYVPYKKCKSIISIIHKICLKVWASQDIPDDWAVAYIVLLQKSDDLSSPSEFRPIAITNTVGKIFFSIIAKRLQNFLTKNSYIDSRTQKGFLFGVPGCIEHSFSLFEALREAKSGKRAIVVSWLDLANAYGSVRHNLIQFALNWYHVPTAIQALIFDYYNKLCAKVTTKEWSTGFFLFDLGLFQGCVLSTILFDCVFNLLLDLLKPLSAHGYDFKSIKIATMDKAYADDLQITTKNPIGHQIVLNATATWLGWTQTMKAKPKKCISLAFRQFTNNPACPYTPSTSTVYSAYDPLLTIAGQPIAFLLNPSIPGFKGRHFKFLGRWISGSLTEREVKEKVRLEYLDLMSTVEKSNINGLMKLWIYQHYIIAKISWPFLIHDFNLDFIKTNITSPTCVFLRRWAGLFSKSDVGVLFRPRAHLGLGLSSPTFYFKKMQVIKCHILAYSSDPDVKAIYQFRTSREAPFKTIWCPTQLTSKVISMVDHETKYPSQPHHDRRGLGSQLFKPMPTQAEHRSLCSTAVGQLETESLLAHSHGLKMQSVWTSWQDTTFPFDLTWKNLIYGPGPRIISFVLNAMINSLPTPDMLKLMKYRTTASCTLCKAEQCTLHHIISNCSRALTGKRYTWRHDSVLLTLLPHLQERVEQQNSAPVRVRPYPAISTIFVPKGSTCASQHKPSSHGKCSLLSEANDWKLLVDFDHNQILFPPHICPTNARPDIILYSNNRNIVVLVELTCPAEEGIPAAKIRKEGRYMPLIEEIKNFTSSRWSPHLMTIEAGARGFVARSMHSFLRKIGFTSSRSQRICHQVSEVTARCSYGIWLMRNNVNWDAHRTLVSPASSTRHSLPPAENHTAPNTHPLRLTVDHPGAASSPHGLLEPISPLPAVVTDVWTLAEEKSAEEQTHSTTARPKEGVYQPH